MSAEAPVLFVVAGSGRALAASAVRAGYRVQVVDGFCDLDTRALGPCLRAPMAGSRLDLARVRHALEARIHRHREQGEAIAGAVVGAGLESTPEVLTWLAARLPLLGNGPEVAQLLANPAAFLQTLDTLGIDHPESRLEPPAQEAASWLLKETGCDGGLSVRHWLPSMSRPRGPHYFQRFVAGTPGSLLFLADGTDVVPVGFNRTLVSDTSDDLPFLYGGVISGLPLSAAQQGAITAWATRLTRHLGLRGLNGIDFVLGRGGRPHLLELNARPTASLALYDDRIDGGLVARHISACRGGLPASAAWRWQNSAGRMILYAWQDLAIPADMPWPAWASDRPYSGAEIARGDPLCSIAAVGRTAEQVEALLRERSRRLVARLESAAISAVEEIL